jgi:hypothetical protein
MKVHFAVALAALSAIVGWAQSSPRQSQTLPELQHIDVMQVDNAIDPCANFYQYACGKLNAANPIPPDQMSWGPDGKLTEWNRLVLRQTLEKTQAASASRTANEQKIGDFYTACTGQATSKADDLAAIQPLLQRIDSIHEKREIAAVLARCIAPSATPGKAATTRPIRRSSAMGRRRTTTMSAAWLPEWIRADWACRAAITTWTATRKPRRFAKNT